jgi:hypothetical protein
VPENNRIDFGVTNDHRWALADYVAHARRRG